MRRRVGGCVGSPSGGGEGEGTLNDRFGAQIGHSQTVISAIVMLNCTSGYGQYRSIKRAVVGWAELAKPNSADTLGFTFVQPNLRGKMNGVFGSSVTV